MAAWLWLHLTLLCITLTRKAPLVLEVDGTTLLWSIKKRLFTTRSLLYDFQKNRLTAVPLAIPLPT